MSIKRKRSKKVFFYTNKRFKNQIGIVDKRVVLLNIKYHFIVLFPLPAEIFHSLIENFRSLIENFHSLIENFHALIEIFRSLIENFRALTEIFRSH